MRFFWHLLMKDGRKLDQYDYHGVEQPFPNHADVKMASWVPEDESKGFCWCIDADQELIMLRRHEVSVNRSDRVKFYLLGHRDIAGIEEVLYITPERKSVVVRGHNASQLQEVEPEKALTYVLSVA